MQQNIEDKTVDRGRFIPVWGHVFLNSSFLQKSTKHKTLGSIVATKFKKNRKSLKKIFHSRWLQPRKSEPHFLVTEQWRWKFQIFSLNRISLSMTCSDDLSKEEKAHSVSVLVNNIQVLEQEETSQVLVYLSISILISAQRLKNIDSSSSSSSSAKVRPTRRYRCS